MSIPMPNPTSDLRSTQAVLFDAYGTLFRLEGIAAACAAILGVSNSDATAFATLWRAKQLEYSVHRSLMGAMHYVDFGQVTAEALDYTLARFERAPSDHDRANLQGAWDTPPPDPDAARVLSALAPRPCAVLSNGAPGMLAMAIETSGLAPHLDAILSADTVRAYKPHPSVYALGTEHYGLPPEAICFVSANSWDAAGAGAFGFRVCWLNRTGLPPDRHGPVPAAAITSLAELPALFSLG